MSETSVGAPLATDHGEVRDIVSEVEWSGGAVPPGQFEKFEVLVGPLPAGVDLLLFPVAQTFSDGSEVRWDQQSFEERAAPERPAPVLTLSSAGGRQQKTDTSNGSNLLALAALVIGGAGLGFGFYTWSVVRRWR